ncbi:MAG: AbrB/MazE/SpoVT family DNA-binding domain-containing protein [Proteobacteria bacterium]|nr:AbrB/MazE/SpoVT family DNA-binding domain-containing protein [Pseudomonadota bacterium]MBU1389612.1 AbrB/MazE/SpoVT family DNA-binding domain-containing protein [Pseudomonadota bacterium]MBU1545088.1 AbrB/MazE/SpoVT family DNA-binding domain-containing protein [Pseudomonadota bacterium]MBU2431519.1 AbrB/MazE/SpoVT family DNA-binding domain-containing protein [Pseudomonadota bacterium]
MATLIRIGNSQGIRIPKAVIEQAQLEDKQLEFKIIDDGLLIQPIKNNRDGWKEQFDKVLKSQESSQADPEWLDAPLVDEEDWEW